MGDISTCSVQHPEDGLLEWLWILAGKVITRKKSTRQVARAPLRIKILLQSLRKKARGILRSFASVSAGRGHRNDQRGNRGKHQSNPPVKLRYHMLACVD